ncbi:hypothetical protein V7O62_06960 [Methanolobus sp. ZRKC2]|uniref:hypothetical protein n=1 Tax=Methanolobus sp. ZRKC2 TaxID=3125783 RepID=UPI0032443916
MSDLSPDGINEKKYDNKVYFWDKFVSNSGTEDNMRFYEIENDLELRNVIRELESKTINHKLSFTEVSPKNASIKKWISNIRNAYPGTLQDDVEYLLDTFRESLYSRSRESNKIIVGFLLTKDVMLLIHSKKDSSLAELKDGIFSAKLILHPKNVLRATLIKNEDGRTTFSAFESSRKWSKGHAEFWGIEPESVSWDSLGNINLTIEVDSFPYPIQLALENEELDEMIRENRISPSGSIKIGRNEGRIIGVNVFKKSMDFSEFFDFYITRKENLEEQRQQFKNLVPLHAVQNYFPEQSYKYHDDIDKVYEITAADGMKLCHDKKHPRFKVGFFTKKYPGINPSSKFLHVLYESIFENRPLEFWHAGEATSRECFEVGSLSIFNEVELNTQMLELSNTLLNLAQDCNSKKKKYLFQNYFCEFWKKNLSNGYLSSLFDFLKDDIIKKEIAYEFENQAIIETEDFLEFKSSSDFNPKPTRFAKDTLVPTVKKYINDNGSQNRYCILYGIEDNGAINPLYHLKSDQIDIIQETTNKILADSRYHVELNSIPFNEGNILSVFILPVVSN